MSPALDHAEGPVPMLLKRHLRGSKSMIGVSENEDVCQRDQSGVKPLDVHEFSTHPNVGSGANRYTVGMTLSERRRAVLMLPSHHPVIHTYDLLRL